MAVEEKSKEQEIYNKIYELEKGDKRDKSLAFDLIGILCNELTNESYEDRLLTVEKMINEYVKEK